MGHTAKCKWLCAHWQRNSLQLVGQMKPQEPISPSIFGLVRIGNYIGLQHCCNLNEGFMPSWDLYFLVVPIFPHIASSFHILDTGQFWQLKTWETEVCLTCFLRVSASIWVLSGSQTRISFSMRGKYKVFWCKLRTWYFPKFQVFKD